MRRISQTILTIWFVLHFISFIVLCPKYASSGEVEFLKVLFTPEKISWTVKLYPVLSERDKQELLNAKDILTDFLKTFQNMEQDPLEYLTPELRKKYTNRADLYMKEFGAEQILEIEIYDFEIKAGNYREIVFHTLLTETTEGIDTTSKYLFSFRSIGQAWLISNLYKDKT